MTHVYLLATSIQARIEALHTRRVAMVAENANRIHNGLALAFSAEDFYALAEELENLSNEAIALSHSL